MTRTKQKDTELALLLPTLSRLGISYTPPIDDGERPDFILDIGGRRIGMEVTEYHTDPGRRAIEEAWSRINNELDEIRQHDSDVRRVYLSLELRSMRLPRANQRSGFVQQLVAFARDMAAQLDNHYIYVKPDSEQWPEISGYVYRIALRKVKSYMHWECSNLEFGGVGTNEQELLRILDTKQSSCEREARRILVVCRWRTSSVQSHGKPLRRSIGRFRPSLAGPPEIKIPLRFSLPMGDSQMVASLGLEEN